MLEEIENLVKEILDGYDPPWPTEITDQVFCAIEDDPQRLGLYRRVVAELRAEGKNGEQVVNQYIGRRVQQLTTGENRGRCYTPQSSLIKSYEKH